MAAAAFASFGSLFVFFVPFIYDATLFQCSNPPGFFFPSCPELQSGAEGGLRSLGSLLFHWGGTYHFGVGYVAPPIDNLVFEALLVYALSLIVVCVGWLAPEIVGVSRVPRIGFAAFGAFVFVLSAFFVSSLNLPFAVLGLILAPTGGAMVAYGMRSLFFHAVSP